MSPYHKVYYWANLIVNPILLLIVLVAPENSFVMLAGWVALSGILNPKIWAWVASLGAGIGIGAVMLACWIAGLGSVVTIAVGAILIGLLVGVLGSVIVIALDVILWVVAFIALKNNGTSVRSLP